MQASLGGGYLHLSVEADRISFWRDQLVILAEPADHSRRALAERMAGRLEFAATAVWGSHPRARFSSLYELALSGKTSPSLSRDVAWLLSLLTRSPTRVLPLQHPSPVAVLYTDASGAPRNGLGSFLFIDGQAFWSATRVPEFVVSALADRKTQINPLEVSGVLAALWTFADRLRGRRVLVLVDNTSALGSLRSGRSRAPDMSELTFITHELADVFDLSLSFFWVPSKLNWADRPSRGAPPLLGAFVPPVVYWDSVARALRA